MTIEEYLTSPRAIEEMRALLDDLPRRPGKIAGSIKPAGESARLYGKSLMATCHKEGAWQRVRINHRRSEGMGEWTTKATIYYRPDEDRFIVTDMGEALKALRLRTGGTPVDANKAGDGVLMEMALGGGSRWPLPPNLCLGGTIEAPQGVTAADLPLTICRVLLAAYRISSLVVVP